MLLNYSLSVLFSTIKPHPFLTNQILLNPIFQHCVKSVISTNFNNSLILSVSRFSISQSVFVHSLNAFLQLFWIPKYLFCYQRQTFLCLDIVHPLPE